MKKATFFFIVILFSCNSGLNEYKDPREKEKLMVFDAVMKEVSRILKCPSTAKFPDKEERIYSVFHKVGFKYSVFSWVDSQNSYGAMIRTRFMIDAEIKGNYVSCSDLIFLEN